MTRPAPASTAAPSPASPTASALRPTSFRPFTPRRKTFVALCVLMAAWIAALVVLYFQTVRPASHPETGPAIRVLNA